MQICHCTLGGTKACMGCSNNTDIIDNFNRCIDMQPYTKTRATSIEIQHIPKEEWPDEKGTTEKVGQ